VISEIDRLRAIEKNPNVKYHAEYISLPTDHSVVRSRGGKDPWGNNPWERLSAAWGTQLLSKAADSDETKMSHNRWSETQMADPSNRMGMGEFVEKNRIDNVDFIKIDIDGEDFYALLGCEDIIDSHPVVGLLLEVNYYGTECETDHTFHNTDRYMREHGFELCDLTVRRYSRRAMPAPFELRMPAQTEWGVPYQGDALYIRDAARPGESGHPPEMSTNKLLKLVTIYEIFGLPDCAAELLTVHRERFSGVVDVDVLLNLLTPRFRGRKLSYREYLRRFSEDITSFYPDKLPFYSKKILRYLRRYL
jgi:hypothetical protein